VADAIARDDMTDLRDELGDLLFQVAFHARLAEEAGEFDFGDVVAAICSKMLRRHPHVFGSDAERAAGAVAGSWDRIKSKERAAGSRDTSVLDGVALALPALKRAQKLGKRASGVGFDWPDTAGVRAKIAEEIAELAAAERNADPAALREEMGDLLFAVVNLARHLGVDAEDALVAANRKFAGRFRHVEKAAADRGEQLADLPMEALEALWDAAKTASVV
jgi:ATP diphosphatase